MVLGVLGVFEGRACRLPELPSPGGMIDQNTESYSGVNCTAVGSLQNIHLAGSS
jgi:hypothetical protein